jgi:ubiquinone/menaquinone biosynthesis C-methylase UbiE
MSASAHILPDRRNHNLTMSTQHETETHAAQIVDQFTRQAEPFVRRHAHSNDGLLEAMTDCAAAGPDDNVLDVACGPGIVSCHFAQRVRHVTGLDMVPAMLERARRFQAEKNLRNVTWQLGFSTELPFAGGTFDCVVTRFSFHHFLEPEIALREMKRVARPRGTILVCDVAPDPETQESFNHWEILRDPSHTHALTEQQFEQLGRQPASNFNARLVTPSPWILKTCWWALFRNPETRIRSARCSPRSSRPAPTAWESPPRVQAIAFRSPTQ